MPRIKKDYLTCVVYLFPSREAAEAGEKAGGSGFLVCVSSDDPRPRGQGINHFYAVTNRHVIQRGSSPVIALNNALGVRQIVPTVASDWIFHPGGDDLAVHPVKDDTDYRSVAIPTTDFVVQTAIFDDIGVGDDVFMMGRFINHQGKVQNTPVARFGNISMLPLEPVLQVRHDNTEHQQESFLVEIRSLSGFSGSPVFWYEATAKTFPLMPHHLNAWQQEQDPRPLRMEMSEPKLLGIDWGNLPAPYRFVKTESMLQEDMNDTRTLNANSGLCAVIPAWKLWELLSETTLQQQRQAIEAAAQSGV